jgi:hypothetical protein
VAFDMEDDEGIGWELRVDDLVRCHTSRLKSV